MASIRFIAVLVLAAVVSTAVPCFAQIVSPPIGRHGVELGLAHKWFDRDVTPPPVDRIKWDVATIYARYGAFNRVTLSAEGGVWNVDNDEFLNAYRRYTMGGGVSVAFYETSSWQFSATANYQTVWDNDISGRDFDKRTRGFNVAALAAYDGTFHGQYLRGWGGPTYVDDRAENFPWGTLQAIRHEPDRHWGATVGGECVLWKHVSGLAYVILLEHPQWRFGLAWRVEGSE